MSWYALILVALGGVLCFVYLLFHAFRGKGTGALNVGKKGMLPPGPPGLPIIGNLLMLGELPHHDLHELAKEYGPIMYLRLAFVPIVIVSSPQAAQQFLKAHDHTFASRPSIAVAKYMSYNCKGLTFSKYGSYWRNMRKMCTLELLSSQKIDCFKSMRREELGLLVESIKEKAQEHVAVDLTAKVASLSANMICRMVFGKKYMDEEFHEKGFKGVIDEGSKLAAVFNIADYVPYIGPLDLQGLNRQMKAVAKIFDDFLEKIIDEHERTRNDSRQRDFIDFMLSFMESNDTESQIDRTNVKAIALDILGAGLDTSGVAVEWALAELIRHPRVMKKVQEELESVVGLERMVEESDLANLEYLNMVVKEGMRLHPPAPLLVPHESTEDCIVNGFLIPKKSRIMVNVWAIGRDPEAWPNPEKFNPDRFSGTSIDLRGHDFQLLPFGSGRRGCPGMQLGLTVVRLILAQLVHCFDWELPNGMCPDDLDMSEKFGIVVSPANHLLAIPSYRLRK